MLGYENRNSPLNHNRESLVGGHFDHQPNNRNALLRESGGYHFDNHHATVTLLVNSAFHYPPHTRNSQRRMPMTTDRETRTSKTGEHGTTESISMYNW